MWSNSSPDDTIFTTSLQQILIKGGLSMSYSAKCQWPEGTGCHHKKELCCEKRTHSAVQLILSCREKKRDLTWACTVIRMSRNSLSWRLFWLNEIMKERCSRVYCHTEYLQAGLLRREQLYRLEGYIFLPLQPDRNVCIFPLGSSGCAITPLQPSFTLFTPRSLCPIHSVWVLAYGGSTRQL